jgi:hypothetical protein
MKNTLLFLASILLLLAMYDDQVVYFDGLIKFIHDVDARN